jgi:hypothetical protein
MDEIEPVPTGTRGDDVVHKVRDSSGVVRAMILWESKRTKAWSRDWPQKVNDHIVEFKADAGVIVSQALPKEIDATEQVDGIWVTNLDNFAVLARVLRDNLVAIAHARLALEGRNEKTEQVYNYINGREFASRVQAIVRAFQGQRTQLATEREAMARIWSRREKEIGRAQENAAGIIGELQAIVGAKELAGLDLLSLPMVDEEPEGSERTTLPENDENLPF